MVQELWELAVRAEVQQEARHPIARLTEPPRCTIGRSLQQPAAGAHRIGIGHDDLSGDHLTTHQPHADRFAATHDDLVDVGLTAHRCASGLKRADHRLDDRIRAALGVPDAIFNLQVRERGVDGWDAIRIATDVERMEAHRLEDVLFGEVLRAEAREVARRIELEHRRQQLGKRQRVLEGASPCSEHGLAVDLAGGLEEGGIVGGIDRRELRELLLHLDDVAFEIDARAVVRPVDPIERIETNQFDLLPKIAIEQSKQLVKTPGHRHKARAEIPGIALVFDLRGASTRCG